MPHPNPEQRARVERETLEQRGFDAQHLLADVHDESVNAPSEHAPLTRTIAKFASLFVVLSDQAEVRAQKNLSAQEKLVDFTKELLAFSAQATEQMRGNLATQEKTLDLTGKLHAAMLATDAKTGKLIRLTYWIVGLTNALLLFTAYLAYDAHHKAGHDEVSNATSANSPDAKLPQ